jgi:prepilin peptidase CpaA
LHYVVLVLAIALLTIVAIGDVRTRRIPNASVLGVLALAVVRISFRAEPSTALHTIAGAAVVFVATCLLYWRGWLGGGDVKLMAATALLVGYRNLFDFLFVTSLFGALIAIAILAVDRLGLHKVRARSAVPHEPPARLTVPYGVAIAVAGASTLLVQTLVWG